MSYRHSDSIREAGGAASGTANGPLEHRIVRTMPILPPEVRRQPYRNPFGGKRAAPCARLRSASVTRELNIGVAMRNSAPQPATGSQTLGLTASRTGIVALKQCGTQKSIDKSPMAMTRTSHRPKHDAIEPRIVSPRVCGSSGSLDLNRTARHGRTLRAIEARLQMMGLITAEQRTARGGFASPD
jgi:hypothetical protein